MISMTSSLIKLTLRISLMKNDPTLRDILQNGRKYTLNKLNKVKYIYLHSI